MFTEPIHSFGIQGLWQQVSQFSLSLSESWENLHFWGITFSDMYAYALPNLLVHNLPTTLEGAFFKKTTKKPSGLSANLHFCSIMLAGV